MIKKFLYNLSIRVKLFLSLFIFSVFITSIMGFTSFLNERKIVNEFVNNYLQSYVKSNEGILVSYITDNNKWELFKFLKGLSQNKLISFAFITDKNGNLIASSNPDVEKLPTGKNLEKYVIKSFNYPIATILVEKDKNYIHNLTVSYVKNTFLVFAIVFISSLALAFIISERILKRIRFTKENLTLISKKQWQKVKKPDFKENDELTEISEALYNMATQLQAYIEEINHLKQFYSEILFQIENIVIVCDKKGDIIFENKNIKEKNISEIFIDKSIFENIKKNLEKGLSTTVELKLNINNKKIWAILNATSYKDRDIFTISDITEIKNLQEQYNLAQKLSTLGDISASLAHELKNMILPLNLYLEDISSLDEEDIQNTRKILQKMNLLIKSFLNFAKPPVESSGEDIDLPSILEESLFLLSPLFQKKGIVLNKYIEKDIKYPINKTAFEIIAVNLIKNAVEASEEGSTVCVILRKSRNSIEFSVRDYGAGISPEIKDKIFEPFVSTKKEGTGLGLSTVYRIVYENNGKIFVNTGKYGTTFIVKFYLEDKDESINYRRSNRGFEIFRKIS